MKEMRAFTLLEVMVAMAILALGLTTILSSQTGLFATTRRVQAETIASTLVRCKMSEVELDLMKRGFPLLDQKDDGPCCDDEEDGFTCEWRVETVELPQPASFETNGEGEDGAAEEDAETALADSEDALDLSSPGSNLSAALPFAGTGADGVSGMEDVAGGLAPAASGGGLIGMALNMVYPTLKPMLEASIRKVTVDVQWKEGEKQRSLQVVQYVTNPMEGNLNPNAAEGIDSLMEVLGQGDGLGSTDDGAEGEQ
jgi:general secretion pathway protein I